MQRTQAAHQITATCVHALDRCRVAPLGFGVALYDGYLEGDTRR